MVKRIGGALALMLAVFTVFACARQATISAPPATGGTLRAALPADVVTLDPAMFTDVYSGVVASQVFEPLFVVDYDQQIVPHLAESLEQPDPSTYIIKLRRGVYFHNGEELTAADVKFSFDRVMDPAVKSPRAWRFTDAIESPDMIEMVDRYTVKLTLKQPFAPFLERLTLASAYVLNQKAVEAAGAEHARQPVGTGPFKLVEQKRGEQITLDRNAEYWGEGAKVDRLVFRPIPDSATRLAELESGGVDHITNLPAEELARLKGEPKVQVLTDEAVNVLYLGYNTRKAPLGNVELRRAMNSAINRDEMLATLYDGVGSVAVSPLNPTSWAFARDAERYDYDPARAAERLAQAGGAPDQPLELAFSQTPETTRAAERIQAQLKDNLGLKVVLKPMEFGTLLNYVKSGNDHQLYILSWSGTGDPDGTLFPLFHSKNFGAAGNRTFYKNERVDELLEKAQRTVDQEARLALYVEAQELIQQDAPWLPIRHGVNSAALGPQVKGYRLHPLNTQDFTSVTVR